MTDNKMVVGYAVYYEIRKGAQTWQLLITPQVMGVVPASMFRRRVSPIEPRKMWKQVASTSMTTPDKVGADRMNFVRTMFDSLVKTEWKMLDGTKPIVVEVTHDDLADIQSGKTPYKIIGRVLKSRKALRFPAKVFGI
jgi:hypothetical protein